MFIFRSGRRHKSGDPTWVVGSASTDTLTSTEGRGASASTFARRLRAKGGVETSSDCTSHYPSFFKGSEREPIITFLVFLNPPLHRNAVS